MDQAYSVATSSSPGRAAMVSACDYLRVETSMDGKEKDTLFEVQDGRIKRIIMRTKKRDLP